MAAALAAVTGCNRDSKTSGPLVVYAASSVQTAFDAIVHAYSLSGGDSVVLVFGSTTDLATQIENGAPADLFFAADEATIERLAARGDVIDSTRVTYAIGRLAIVSRCPANVVKGDFCVPKILEQLSDSGIRHVAIANPAHAPYGRAAQQVLERSGMWNTVKPKIVMGASVAQAMQFVASGNADIGLVAFSVVLDHRSPLLIHTGVDSTLYDPIHHVAAVVEHSPDRTARSMKFLAFVRGDMGRQILSRQYFDLPDTVNSRR